MYTRRVGNEKGGEKLKGSKETLLGDRRKGGGVEEKAREEIGGRGKSIRFELGVYRKG